MKIFKVLYYIFIAFIAVIVILLIVSVFPITGNYKLIIVQSGSMESVIKMGFALIIIVPAAIIIFDEAKKIYREIHPVK